MFEQETVAMPDHHAVATIDRAIHKKTVRVKQPAAVPMHVAPDGNRAWIYQSLKRATDIAGALVALVCFSPIMLVSFLILMVTTKGRPIFVQQRVGLCGKLFNMY